MPEKPKQFRGPVGTKINREKSDLNKDGKLSNYEKRRGSAIAKSMAKKQPMGREKLAGGGSVGFAEQTVSTGKMPKKQKRIQIAGFGKARR